MTYDKAMYRALMLLYISFFSTSVMISQAYQLGVDLSYVNEMEDCGAVYNVDDVETDPFEIFRLNGADLVRLRLWHTPAWYDGLNGGQRYSDFDDVMISIMRAKEEGMDVLLDFHLSDNWADPSKQVAPAAWNDVLDDPPVLQDSLYNYIYSTLHNLAIQDLLPEIVQIGNETNRGILLSQEVNDSGWTLDWERNSALFNSAIDAVRDIELQFAKDIKIALHIADPQAVDWYIGQFVTHGVEDFDIIGISYYWQWHQHTIEEVGEYVRDLKNDYPDKEVMILETAYPWTSQNADGANNILSIPYPGYHPFNPTRQKDWMIALTQAVIDNGGSGVVYWEPAWVTTECETQWATGSSWDNAVFFDASHTLITNGGIMWLTHPYNVISSVDHNLPFDKFSIYLQDHLLIIERNEGSLLSGPFEITITVIDGRIIFAQRVTHDWIADRMHIQIPELTTGYYVVNLVEGGTRYNPGIVLNR